MIRISHGPRIAACVEVVPNRVSEERWRESADVAHVVDTVEHIERVDPELIESALGCALICWHALRKGMGDVHGTKKTLEHLVFKSLKWAVIISTIFKGAGVK
jgi:hypothetical protein